MSLTIDRPPVAPDADATVPPPADTSFLASFSLGDAFVNRVRWTRDVCDDLERYGFLPARYELIDGEIISKMGQNPPHVVTLGLLLNWLRTVFGELFVLGQAPVQVAEPDSPTYRPEPDAAVYFHPFSDYGLNAPGPGDVRLVAEVSDTTLRDDLTVKAGLYARAGFPEYWVLDITGRRIVVHRAPENGVYSTVFVFADNADNTEVSCEAVPDRPVLVATLFPPIDPASETNV